MRVYLHSSLARVSKRTFSGLCLVLLLLLYSSWSETFLVSETRATAVELSYRSISSHRENTKVPKTSISHRHISSYRTPCQDAFSKSPATPSYPSMPGIALVSPLPSFPQSRSTHGLFSTYQIKEDGRNSTRSQSLHHSWRKSVSKYRSSSHT